MPLEPKEIWQKTMKDLEAVDNVQWVQNLSNWLFERVNAKMQISGIVGPVSYTFNKSVFMAQMMTATPVNTMALAAMKLGTAWEAAVLASNMSVMPGSALGAPTPPTMWSAPLCVIDPGPVSAAKAKLIKELSDVKLVDDALDSKLPALLREAFLMLTFTTSGINCLPIPTPLVAPCLPAV